MRTKIYQINSKRDVNRVKFEGLELLERYQGSSAVDPSIYDEVFSAEIDATDLEAIYQRFNTVGHPLHRGHSLSVSDVVVNDNGAFFCDSIGFQPIAFDESQTQKPDNLMRVVYVEPHKAPYIADVAHTSGSVEVLFTFDAKLIKTDTNIVVFESLYRDSKELTVHADIEDEGQSVKVYVPEIKTTASIDGKKEVTTAGKVTIEDVVSYTNLIPGTEYTIRGTLMNKATGEVFTVNGETITAEVKFTPESRNGEVKVTFTFDAHDLTTSTKVVVFESLYRDDVEITTHKDIEDKDQTVTITPPPDVPQTGDNSNLGVWIGLGGIALGGAIACVIMYFKKKKDDGEK